MRYTLIKVFTLIIAVSFCQLAHAQQPTPEQYGKLPEVTEVQISPDGSVVAALHFFGDEAAVLFYDLSGSGQPPYGTKVGSAKARHIQWAGNDYLLLLASSAETVPTSGGLKTIEFERWVSINKNTQKAEILFKNEAGFYLSSAGELLSTLPDEPDHAIFARWSTQQRSGPGSGYGTTPNLLKLQKTGSYTLFKVNLKNGRTTRVDSGKYETDEWIVDENGEIVARVDYDEQQQKRKVYKREGKSKNLNLLTEFDEPRGLGKVVSFHGMAPGQDKLYATTYGNRDKPSLLTFDLEAGNFGDTVFTLANYDFDRIVYDPNTSSVSAVLYVEDMPNAHFLNEDDNKTATSLKAAMPDATPIIRSKSQDGSRAIIEAVYSDHPSQFFIFDKQARSLNMISATYPALDGNVVAKKEKYDFVSSDGFTIHGYLTAPKGATKQNLPLIVLPHGGPAGRDDMAFGWWEFFYAARGYLVYQPNFRGSDGYGYRFRSAGYGEWGRKMQDDITDGVKKLIADGVVDPGRICIVGASYGGYAALAGATLTPDLYACAVSVNGISNLPGMLGHESNQGDLDEDYWTTRIGNRFRDSDELSAVSPGRQAEKVKAPVMLIVSKDDVVVPPWQSTQMRDALNRAGKSNEFVELDGEDHWLSTSPSRTEMLRRSIEFIDQHIGQ